MPVAQVRDELGREAPGFASIQEHRENTSRIYFPFEPLRDITSTENAITWRTKDLLGGFIDSSVDVVMI